MKPEYPKFDPQYALQAVQTFGWHSVSIDHPEAVVAKFCEEHRLGYTKHFFHWVLKPLEAVAETTAGREAHWEKIRQEQHARKQRLAAAKKKKEATK